MNNPGDEKHAQVKILLLKIELTFKRQLYI